MPPRTLLFYDTETTGFPDWHTPSDDPCQPHIVQLACQLIDEGTREVIASDRWVGLPDGWTIPDEAAAIHGTTTEQALELGMAEPDLLDEFKRQFWDEATCRIAYNDPFDARIMRIAMKRFRPDWMDAWKVYPHSCAMQMAKPVCKIAPTDKMMAMGRKTFKSPKLEEAYKILIGREMENAHDAMADVEATVAVFFEIERRKAEEAEFARQVTEARDG